MLGRIVVGVRRCDADRPVLRLATALASQTGSGVHVVHVRERRCTKVGPCYSESMADASLVVEEAVFELRMAGVGASGKVTSALQGRVAQAILDQAGVCEADAIVVGWHQRRGLRRLMRTGDRERLMRLSRLPVILAPLVAGRRGPQRQGHKVRTQLAR
jgi:nucleotide-binding universal stress UspA family protein